MRKWQHHNWSTPKNANYKYSNKSLFTEYCYRIFYFIISIISLYLKYVFVCAFLLLFYNLVPKIACWSNVLILLLQVAEIYRVYYYLRIFYLYVVVNFISLYIYFASILFVCNFENIFTSRV